jgi:hypothetical protein
MERPDDEREVETDRSGEAGKVDEEATSGDRGKWPYRGQEQREQQRGRKRRKDDPSSD